VTLVARGEFSMVIAALGATLQPELGSFAAAYVLFLVVLGPVLARLAK
jgi:CPA2 family monovalent cation:H+ antiporter-2